MAKQQLKQKQHLKVLPLQLQLMRYLSLPLTDLSQSIEREATENPMLEIVPDTDDSYSDDYTDDSFEIEPEEGENNTDELEIESINKGADPFEDFDDDDEDYRYRERLSSDPNAESYNTEIASSTSITQSLLEQLSYKNLTNRERIIGETIICSLDDTGYLTRDIYFLSNDVALKNNIEATPEEIEHILHTIQQLDPPGIGARTAQECILIQLRRLPASPTTALAMDIMEHYFDQWSTHQYELIAKKKSLSNGQLQEIKSCIRHLNPKPGLNFNDNSDTAAHILPDFIVTADDNQSLTLTLNENGIPNVQISNEYLSMLHEYEKKTKPTICDKEALRFLREKNENAQSFIEMLNQRQTTLYSIMHCIVKLQKEFLLSGNESDLKPMKLQDIADRTGYDPSTISRVVNEKYVQTDFGTLLLKEFFSKSIATEEGTVSAKKLQETIRKAIAEEDPLQPLTDEMLVDLLSKEGYSIARRTIAKYRTEFIHGS